MIQYIETVHIRLTKENQNLMGKLHGTAHIIVIKGFWKGLWHNFLKCNSEGTVVAYYSDKKYLSLGVTWSLFWKFLEVLGGATIKNREM